MQGLKGAPFFMAEIRNNKYYDEEKETSPKGTLITPHLNPEAEGMTLPLCDVSFESKDGDNNDSFYENSENNEQMEAQPARVQREVYHRDAPRRRLAAP